MMSAIRVAWNLLSRRIKNGKKETSSPPGASPDAGDAKVHFKSHTALPDDIAPPGSIVHRRIAGLGWKPDLPDGRDQYFSVAGPILQALPSAVDLRSQDTPIYDQGQIGSCTANAIAGAIAFDRKKLGLSPDFVPARLFIYYNERSIEGNVANDSGAFIRDGIKSVNKLGVPPEADWPYVPTPAAYEGGPFPHGSKPATRPDPAAYKDALNHTLTAYQRLMPALVQLKGALAQGYPFVFGFTVYDNLYDPHGKPKTVIPLPGSASAIGGHAVMAIGYNDATQLFIFRNSWGPSLGEKGYFYIPYAYLTGFASDFWVLRGISH